MIGAGSAEPETRHRRRRTATTTPTGSNAASHTQAAPCMSRLSDPAVARERVESWTAPADAKPGFESGVGSWSRSLAGRWRFETPVAPPTRVGRASWSRVSIRRRGRETRTEGETVSRSGPAVLAPRPVSGEAARRLDSPVCALAGVPTAIGAEGGAGAVGAAAAGNEAVVGGAPGTGAAGGDDGGVAAGAGFGAGAGAGCAGKNRSGST
jgi:hypothetical protein